MLSACVCLFVREWKQPQLIVNSYIDRHRKDIKGTWSIPISYLPSLATSCENMALNSERKIGKSRNFQIVYAGRTNLSKQTNWPLTKLGILKPPHYPIGIKRVHVNTGLSERIWKWGGGNVPRVRTGFGKFWKVLEIDQCVFQDLESLGKSSFCHGLWKVMEIYHVLAENMLR